VSQEILNGHEISVGVEQLCRHGVAELVTAYLQTRFLAIVFHSLLDTANRYGFTSKSIKGSNLRLTFLVLRE